MDHEHNRAGDQQAVGDVEIWPGVVLVAEENPIADSVGELLRKPGGIPESKPVEEIAQDSRGDAAERNRQPAIAGSAVNEKPSENAAGSQNGERGEQPPVAGAHAKKSSAIYARFDADITFDNPPFIVGAGQSAPGEHPLLGRKIDRTADDGDAKEQDISAGRDYGRVNARAGRAVK